MSVKRIAIRFGYHAVRLLAQTLPPDPVLSPPRSRRKQERPCRATCAPVCDFYAPGRVDVTAEEEKRAVGPRVATCGGPPFSPPRHHNPGQNAETRGTAEVRKRSRLKRRGCAPARPTPPGNAGRGFCPKHCGFREGFGDMHKGVVISHFWKTGG